MVINIYYLSLSLYKVLSQASQRESQRFVPVLSSVALWNESDSPAKKQQLDLNIFQEYIYIVNRGSLVIEKLIIIVIH